MSQSKIIFTKNELPKIVQNLAELLKNCNVVEFIGPLGAGKTTIIRELLRLYGVKGDILSPTFTYMNLYKNDEGKTFFHFDLYRIKKVDDFLMAGFDEYLITPNSISFIEWPEVIEPLLKLQHLNVCKITIDYHDQKDERILTLSNIV